jgi:hypothetical protein
MSRGSLDDYFDDDSCTIMEVPQREERKPNYYAETT